MIYSAPENPRCSFCAHSNSNKESGNILCDIKGTVPADYACKKFKYDIFKKKIKPRKAKKMPSFTPDDFSL